MLIVRLGRLLVVDSLNTLFQEAQCNMLEPEMRFNRYMNNNGRWYNQSVNHPV